jgi:hypothetical protein
MRERAAIVVPLPLSVVESNVWDVTSWSSFLGEVDWVERTAHERYVFGIREGRRVHDVPVHVRWFARDHRVAWRELTGPTWRGEIRLTALNGRRTRLALESAAQPRSFGATVTDLLGRNRHQAEADVGRLAERMAHIPQPFNPTRLPTPHRGGGRAAVRAAHQADYLASHSGEAPATFAGDVQILEA